MIFFEVSVLGLLKVHIFFFSVIDEISLDEENRVVGEILIVSWAIHAVDL